MSARMDACSTVIAQMFSWASTSSCGQSRRPAVSLHEESDSASPVPAPADGCGIGLDMLAERSGNGSLDPFVSNCRTIRP